MSDAWAFWYNTFRAEFCDKSVSSSMRFTNLDLGINNFPKKNWEKNYTITESILEEQPVCWLLGISLSDRFAFLKRKKTFKFFTFFAQFYSRQFHFFVFASRDFFVAVRCRRVQPGPSRRQRPKVHVIYQIPYDSAFRSGPFRLLQVCSP